MPTRQPQQIQDPFQSMVLSYRASYVAILYFDSAVLSSMEKSNIIFRSNRPKVGHPVTVVRIAATQKHKDSHDYSHLIGDAPRLGKFRSQPQISMYKAKPTNTVQRKRLMSGLDMTRKPENPKQPTSSTQPQQISQAVSSNPGWFQSCMSTLVSRNSYQVYLSPSSILTNRAMERNYREQIQKSTRSAQNLRKHTET